MISYKNNKIMDKVCKISKQSITYRILTQSMSYKLSLENLSSVFPNSINFNQYKDQ